jgi:hypothetical protein
MTSNRSAPWRGVPWSVWAFEAVLVANIVFVDVSVSASAVLLAASSVLFLVAGYFLLHGVRWLWILMTALFIVTIPSVISGSQRWEGVVLTLVGLTLLLLPATRRFYRT